MTGSHLPDDVASALRAGRRIEAIKLLREARGLSLKEAKEAVEGAEITPGAGHPGELPDDVVDALRAGQKIEAVRRLRRTTGMGLKDAKDVVDASGIERDPVYAARFQGDPGPPRALVVALVIGAALALWWFFA